MFSKASEIPIGGMFYPSEHDQCQLSNVHADITLEADSPRELSDELCTSSKECIARGGARAVTVDLDGASVFSSSAVQAVHDLRRDLAGLRLHASTDSVAGRVLALTGLDDLRSETAQA